MPVMAMPQLLPPDLTCNPSEVKAISMPCDGLGQGKTLVVSPRLIFFRQILQHCPCYGRRATGGKVAVKIARLRVIPYRARSRKMMDIFSSKLMDRG